MPILSKPCGREGCTELVTAPIQSRLDRMKYHSKSCAMTARLATGWKPPLTQADRIRGAKLGGAASGRLRHRRTLIKAVQQCERFLDDELKEGLSARQLAKIRALMGRVFMFAHLRGRQNTDADRRYWRKKGQAA